MDTVISADGTVIAFDRLGEGPPVLFVAGATCDREFTRAHADGLARRFTVINYDRRGRGDSGDTAPYTVEREVQDIAALIAAAGGRAALYGHSSGAALVLHAAAAGLPIDRIVVHEAPYGPGDDESCAHARDYADRLAGLLAAGRRGDAMALFMRLTGMPEQIVDEVRRSARWPVLEALAPTLAHDSAVMGDRDRGGAVPWDLIARIRVPALILCGGDSPEWMIGTGRAIADALPEAELAVLAGHGHVAPPEVLLEAVTGFLAATVPG